MSEFSRSSKTDLVSLLQKSGWALDALQSMSKRELVHLAERGISPTEPALDRSLYAPIDHDVALPAAPKAWKSKKAVKAEPEAAKPAAKPPKYLKSKKSSSRPKTEAETILTTKPAAKPHKYTKRWDVPGVPQGKEVAAALMALDGVDTEHGMIASWCFARNPHETQMPWARDNGFAGYAYVHKKEQSKIVVMGLTMALVDEIVNRIREAGIVFLRYVNHIQDGDYVVARLSLPA